MDKKIRGGNLREHNPPKPPEACKQPIHGGWQKIDFAGELRYSFKPMPSLARLTYLLALAGMFQHALPAYATEPANSLLTELSWPSAVNSSTAEMPALVSPFDAEDANDETAAPVSDLFTLDELKGKPDESTGLSQ